jgi:glycosyltransferase involved in cell wall biosynthesis
MRTLHVAALPFPSFQGTQALLQAMLTALSSRGREVELLTYAHGTGGPAEFPVQRARSLVPGRSLRSGPSLEKLVHDAGLALSLRERERAFRPDIIVAHHIEAALAALSVCRAPVAYVAHTSLEMELPSYASRRLAVPLSRAGAVLERAVCRRAAHTLAVSPLLARMLAAASGVNVATITLPWSVPLAIDAAERSAARLTLGLAPGSFVPLYAGNLDAYQGLHVLGEGLTQLIGKRDFTMLIATGEPRALSWSPVLRDRVHLLPIQGEPARRLAHAAADVALVPRASPGGLPIKLLDALARGVPVLAARRASAGLSLDAVCDLVPDDDAAAWTRALADYTPDPERSVRARDYMVRTHHADAFVSSFEAALCC